MHFQEIRRAAAQGTISLPPPMDSEGLEDLAVLKSCLKVIRELSEFRYAFAKDAMAETFAPLMASVEAKNEAEVLDYVQYNPKKLVRTLETWVTQSVKEGRISVEEGKEFLSNYRSGLYGYTYLE